MTTHQRAPLFQSPHEARLQLGGVLGERLRACMEQWLLRVPAANPALLGMFRDRDRQPARDLLPWSGELVGKYLTSAVLCWRSTRDQRLCRLLERTVDELIGAQDQDGYLGPFPRAKRLLGRSGGDEYARFSGGEYALWDLWGHYHCLLGLLLWHQETGSQAALDACVRAADLLCATFLDGPARVHDAGAAEMNMAIAHGLCLLYECTADPRYLALVREIEADWERPPAGDYVRQALAGRPFFQMPAPRWESLHDVQAIAELFFLTGNRRYRVAFEQIWRSIAKHDRHNTGGFSSGEQASGDPYSPDPIETCATVAWMALSVDMLRMTGNPLVADELELTTYNGLVGGQSTSGRWWTYNTPMDGVKRASAHDLVFQARPGSPELNCCSVNGPRGLGMLSEWVVMLVEDGAVINGYLPSSITVTLPGGTRLLLTQETDYPVNGTVLIRLGLAQEARVALWLRIPSWSRRTRVRLNGAPLSGAHAGTYLPLERIWQDGDLIELELDMGLHFWFGERQCAGKASIYRGPLLLAFDPRYNQVDPNDLPVLSIETLSGAADTWDGPLPPWLLLKFQTRDGRSVRLCDFASAGVSGTEYRSWLQVQEPGPRPPDRVRPVWAARASDA